MSTKFNTIEEAEARVRELEQQIAGGTKAPKTLSAAVIRAAARRAGSTKKLAELLQVNPQGLYRSGRGARGGLGLSTLERVARAVNVAASQLLLEAEKLLEAGA